jgi:hypothetical protein
MKIGERSAAINSKYLRPTLSLCGEPGVTIHVSLT